MSLDRKDVRPRLTGDYHALLQEVADYYGLDINEWAGRVLVAALQKEAHRASELWRRMEKRGISRISRDSQPDQSTTD